MAEFLIEHLKKKYPNAFEYSYSLNQAFDKYPNNDLIQFFAGVLYGQVCQSKYLFKLNIHF
jgi:hypothetical protein